MGTSLRTSDRRVRIRHRSIAVGAAVLAAFAVWLVAVPVLDVRLALPDFKNPEGEIVLGLMSVVATSLAAALVGWAVLAVLERLTTRRAARLWTRLAVIALLVSFAGPLASPGLAMSTRVSLAAMHVAVAAVLIPLLYRSSPSS